MPYSDVGTFCLSDVPWTDRHVQELRYEVNQLTYSQPVMRPRWFCHYMHTLLRRVGPFLLKFSLNPRGLEYRPLVTAELVALLPSMAPAITELTMANCLVSSCIFFSFMCRYVDGMQHFDFGTMLAF